MKNHLKIVIFFTMLIQAHVGLGQSQRDSLQRIVDNTRNDSIRIEALISLSNAVSEPTEAIDLGERALSLAQEKGFVRLVGEVANILGIHYYSVGNYEKTLDLFYQAQNTYEKLQDSAALSRSYNNIGLVLSDLGRTEETIEYHQLSLNIKQSMGDLAGMANSYSNLGLAYEAIDSLDLAMEYYRKALAIDEQQNDVYGLFIINSNIGHNHFIRENYDSATFYYNRAVMLADQIDNNFNKAELLRDYAALNAAQQEYTRAIEKYNSSLQLAQSIGAKTIIRDAYLGLSRVYEKQENITQAFDYYKKHDSVSNLIYNEERTKMLSEIETNYQIQHSRNEIELLRKEAEIKDLRLRNNSYTMYFLGAAIFFIFIIVVLQYRKNIYRNRTNRLLKIQHDEIAEKNKDIMDSIAYARQIQKTLLPDQDKLAGLFQDAFVYAKARDLVSGDFYWLAEKGEYVLIAVVDCTGHGVPAAFLNVMGNFELNNIVIERDIQEPAEILQPLNVRVLSMMNS
ncbi:MAG: tetratricopeptide repeat protein, partial [Fulvivirga sp.]|nr:tetratricopeptide repeat protein [Fulvivirga sp.]